jgi:hypothetical protein
VILILRIVNWRVGLVVSTSDSESGVAGSSPDEGTVHQCVTSLDNIFTRACSGQPGFSSFRVDKLVPASAGVNVLYATTGTASG